MQKTLVSASVHAGETREREKEKKKLSFANRVSVRCITEAVQRTRTRAKVIHISESDSIEVNKKEFHTGTPPNIGHWASGSHHHMLYEMHRNIKRSRRNRRPAGNFEKSRTDSGTRPVLTNIFSITARRLLFRRHLATRMIQLGKGNHNR